MLRFLPPMFFFKTPTKSSSRAKRQTDLLLSSVFGRAESKDLDYAHLVDAVRSFSTAQARPQRTSAVEPGWLKGANGMGRISTLGVLRLRARKGSVCDKSVRRFAQDDGFLGGVKYDRLDVQETRKDRKKSRALRMTIS
jgi:hypothetical protein